MSFVLLPAWDPFRIALLMTAVNGALACVIGIRAGKSLEWDGEKMEAKNAPEAARFVHTKYRTKWLK